MMETILKTQEHVEVPQAVTKLEMTPRLAQEVTGDPSPRRLCEEEVSRESVEMSQRGHLIHDKYDLNQRQLVLSVVN